MDERLEAIRQRAEKARPGQWLVSERVYSSEDSCDHTLVSTEDDDPGGGNRIICHFWKSSEMEPQDKADAEFIAHSRDDIPYLLGLVEELRAALRPLLENPLETDADNVCDVCRFCGADDHATYTPAYHRPILTHKPDCPVLSADRLLGRTPETAAQ